MEALEPNRSGFLRSPGWRRIKRRRGFRLFFYSSGCGGHFGHTSRALPHTQLTQSAPGSFTEPGKSIVLTSAAAPPSEGTHRRPSARARGPVRWKLLGLQGAACVILYFTLPRRLQPINPSPPHCGLRRRAWPRTMRRSLKEMAPGRKRRGSENGRHAPQLMATRAE